MFLQRLLEYSRRFGVSEQLPPPGYDLVNVHHVIDLSAGGREANVTPLGDDGAKSRRGRRLSMPQTATKTSGVVALPFFGNGQYVLGLVRDPAKPKRAEDEHAAFLSLVDAYAELERPEIAAVQEFFRAGGASILSMPADFNASDTMTFRVDGQFVTELPAVQARWQQRIASPDMPVMQCGACGIERPITRILEGKVKGIPGGQTAGTAIISANAEAFSSYGLEASLIAPTCADCGNRFTKALNALLADERAHIRLGDGSVTLFWTREPQTEFNPFTLLEQAEPDDVRVFLEGIKSGRPGAAPVANRFYAAALSAAGGRAVVREWIDVTLPEAEDALGRWFRRQAVVDVNSGERRYFSLRALCGATVLKLQDISPPTTRTLLRSALTGAPLPLYMMAAAIRRARAEQRVTAPQAALIKLVLTSRRGHIEEVDDMIELRAPHPSVGYQCGRLLAVLEAVQRAALPGVKAGIVDRYFGSASSAPGNVFPRLVRGAQPHLGRLERDRPAAQVALQRRLEDVLALIPGFPRVLTLEEQGYFALGYYHQRQDFFAKKTVDTTTPEGAPA